MRFKTETKTMNVYSNEFRLKAQKVTGIEWDFSRLLNGSYRCCVKNCWFQRLYGHWVCSEHLLVELKHFDPKGDHGFTFWSHIGKNKRIKELEKETRHE